MYWKSIAVGLCAVGAATASTSVPTLGLRNSHDVSSGSLGFVASLPAGAAAGRTHLALSRKPVHQRAGSSLSSMKMTRATNLVTFGDVWRETCEEEDLCDMVWEEQHQENTNPIVACGTFVSTVATNVWDHLTADPSPEEVQASLAAFAKAHGGAVMTPMSDSELEKELRFCGMFPDLVDSIMELELSQELVMEEVPVK
mmetsp:Transcript_10332/g.24431  ORF Transcript_10332/g.24431 Transcript_10332/m.24431 type:complete len:199 (-) Transcript_10332:117-713(-)|eukprot:257126-Rhodomonas_salina.2